MYICKKKKNDELSFAKTKFSENKICYNLRSTHVIVMNILDNIISQEKKADRRHQKIPTMVQQISTGPDSCR